MESRLPPNIKYGGPWPLPTNITTKICFLAGREASASLCVALGDSESAAAARVGIYHEPFTYWDWHGVHPDETFSGLKTQLMWERRHHASSTGTIRGYPSSAERWRIFKRTVEAYPERKEWIKHIAMAHWMDDDDLRWIAYNLPNLIGLDLSDCPKFEKLAPSSTQSPPPSPFLIANGAATQDIVAVERQFRSLIWLGLPDWRGPDAIPRSFINSILPACANLKTLSIRGKYAPEIIPENMNLHDYVCRFIGSLVENLPVGVETLELRLSIPFLDRLVGQLSQSMLGIKRVGIDLGAWVQVYPLRATRGGLTESAIKRAATLAAHKARFDMYEAEHNKVLPKDSKWWLPEPPGLCAGNIETTEAKHAFERDFYRLHGGSDLSPSMAEVAVSTEAVCPFDAPEHSASLFKYLEDSRVDSLSAMLYKLYDMGTHFPTGALAINLFPLQPEWQTNSTNPLHPYSIIQPVPSKYVKSTLGLRYDAIRSTELSKVYAWLNATFIWRPVFDWDWFMISDPFDLKKNLDHAYRDLPEVLGLDNQRAADSHFILITETVANHFRDLRAGGIPVHLLVGRRPTHASSLYWGWPYKRNTWPASLEETFYIGQSQIASTIDTLSIFYDLRHPLDRERLVSISRKEPGKKSQTTWTSNQCGCKDTNKCDHISRWVPSWIGENRNHDLDTGSFRRSTSRSRLADNLQSHPFTGDDANSYDFESDDIMAEPSLHQLATKAAYYREAFAWIRFWDKYSRRLINVTKVQIRMPKDLARFGSARVAQLLSPREGWKVVLFTDERQHMPPPKTCGQQSDRGFWSAGWFVRSTWIRDEDSTGSLLDAIEGKIRPDEEDIVKYEYQETKNALNRARKAGDDEYNRERQLDLAAEGKYVAEQSPYHQENKDIKSRLEGMYGQHLYNVAEKEWTCCMETYIERLDKGHLKWYSQGGPNSDPAIATLEANDAEGVHKLLDDTRTQMEIRLKHFRAEDVFQVMDTAYVKKDLDSLTPVKANEGLRAEEARRRGKPVVSGLFRRTANAKMLDEAIMNGSKTAIIADASQLVVGIPENLDALKEIEGEDEETQLRESSRSPKYRAEVQRVPQVDVEELEYPRESSRSPKYDAEVHEAPPVEIEEREYVRESSRSPTYDDSGSETPPVEVEEAESSRENSKSPQYPRGGSETLELDADELLHLWESSFSPQHCGEGSGSLEGELKEIESPGEIASSPTSRTQNQEMYDLEEQEDLEETDTAASNQPVDSPIVEVSDGEDLLNAKSDVDGSGNLPQQANGQPQVLEQAEEVEISIEDQYSEIKSSTSSSPEHATSQTTVSETIAATSTISSKKRKIATPVAPQDANILEEPPRKKQATARTRKTIRKDPHPLTPETASEDSKFEASSTSKRPVRVTRSSSRKTTETPEPTFLDSESGSSDESDNDNDGKRKGKGKAKVRRKKATHSAEAYEPPGTKKRAARGGRGGRGKARGRGARGKI